MGVCVKSSLFKVAKSCLQLGAIAFVTYTATVLS